MPSGILQLRLSRDPAARHLLIGLPVLTVAILGLADWTLAGVKVAGIQAAARAAADVVRAHPEDSEAIIATVRAAAGLPAMSIAPPAAWCECAEVPIDCSAICAGGLGRYMRIAASVPYSRISPVGPTSVTGQVTLRLP